MIGWKSIGFANDKVIELTRSDFDIASTRSGTTISSWGRKQTDHVPARALHAFEPVFHIGIAYRKPRL